LEAKNIQIKETVSANKKLQEKDARALLKAANSLIAAKGKKVEEFDTREKNIERLCRRHVGRNG
jgi:hypothetical protein